MNLSSLLKSDPFARDIVDSSAHVGTYSFHTETCEWQKTAVEGPLIIYSRHRKPYYSMFIINCLKTTTFIEPITAQLEVCVEPPFIVYRNESARIRGFWLRNNAECLRIGSLISTLTPKEPEQDGTTSATEKTGNTPKTSSKAKNNCSSWNKAVIPSNVLEFFEAAKRIGPTPALPRGIRTVKEVEAQYVSIRSLQNSNKTFSRNENDPARKTKAYSEMCLGKDKAWLEQAMCNVILNDEDFAHKLREAYIQSCAKYTNKHN